MDTLSAFAMGMANRNKPSRVFDWHKAAQLIRDRKPKEASAGLSQDWEWTGGPIFRDGNPVPRDETYTYLASTWATPELDLDGESIECWVWEENADENPHGWGPNTYWPDSALSILRGDDLR